MIYLTGDVHLPIDVEKLNTKNFPEQKNLTRDDYLIILGDFGLLWHKDREYYWWKQWFENKPFTTLWIDGNHENHEWIDSLSVSEWKGGNVHYVSDNIIHLMRGQVFTIDKKRFWTFGGAGSIDKIYRVEGKTWWAREQGSYGEQMEGLENLERYGNKVDYILTHTCPDSLITSMFNLKRLDEDSTTGKYLEHVSEIADYKRWFFGHWHESKDFGKFSVLYNVVRPLSFWSET